MEQFLKRKLLLLTNVNSLTNTLFSADITLLTCVNLSMIVAYCVSQAQILFITCDKHTLSWSHELGACKNGI